MHLPQRWGAGQPSESFRKLDDEPPPRPPRSRAPRRPPGRGADGPDGDEARVDRSASSPPASTSCRSAPSSTPRRSRRWRTRTSCSAASPRGPPPGRGVLSGLVLNEKGLDRALACGVPLVCLGVSASDTHSRKNTGMDTTEATRRIVATARMAVAGGPGRPGVRPVRVRLRLRGARSRGARPLDREGIPRRGPEADFTRGHGGPRASRSGRATLRGRSSRSPPDAEPACHFHDTYGLGMANVFAAMRAGAVSFESSFAGLGGCPFTKVAAGNVATEDLVHGWQRSGLSADVDLGVL